MIFIFTHDGDDRFGAIFLMKFESKSGRDSVEVTVSPGFVATLDNITMNAIGSGNGKESVQESGGKRSHGASIRVKAKLFN